MNVSNVSQLLQAGRVGLCTVVLFCLTTVLGLHAQTPALEFNFEDTGTKTQDPVSGRKLDLVNSFGVAADLHGADGSGVYGFGQALDLRSGTYSAGPLASSVGNTNINFGTVTNFTVTMWIKPKYSMWSTDKCLFFALGANGTSDYGEANSISLRCNGDSGWQLHNHKTAVTAKIGTNGTSTSNPWLCDMPTNQWVFIAMTYDGANFSFYRGTENDALTLQASESGPAWSNLSVNVGSSYSMLVGNNLARNRTFLGQMDDVRFYIQACTPTALEIVRQLGAFQIGLYKPDANTTGVLPGTTLAPYNATNVNSFTITTANTVIENKIIYGDIKIQASNVVIRNCRLVGGNHIPTSASGIVDCNGANVFNALIENCDIFPRKISLNRDGIVGHEYTARRNHVKNTIDGFGVFNCTSPSNSFANVRLEGNYVHDLAYFFPDYTNGVSGNTAHTDGTHNDGCQVQGGANIHILGNNFTASSIAGPETGINPDKPWLIDTGNANGSALLIQKGSKLAPLVNVVAEQNFLSRGLAAANLHPGTYTFQNNICSSNVASRPSNPKFGPYYIRIKERATSNIIGLLSPGNYFEETGVQMVEPQLKGIKYDN
jgi:hypothetical protein